MPVRIPRRHSRIGENEVIWDNLSHFWAVRGIPAGREGVYRTVRGIPAEREGVYRTVRGIPAEREGVYRTGRGIPAEREGVYRTVRGIPAERERVYRTERVAGSGIMGVLRMRRHWPRAFLK
jgi:hypothetical protein